MKIVGIISAILVIAGVLSGLGYGAISGFEFLSAQWERLAPDWKASIIVISSLLILCTLFLALLLRSAIKRYGLKGPGKVMAYNNFAHWYSVLKSDDAEALLTENFRTVINQMTLWGSAQVIKQVNLLYELLQQEETTKVELLKKADHVYIEIRRDLGLGGSIEKNAIV